MMNFFFILNGKRIKQILIIVIAAFFTAWFFFLESYSYIPAFSNNDEPRALYKGENGIALTFNIGWGDEKAEPILDTLAKLKVKNATFFLAGSWAESHPDLVERIMKEGYEIGILGYEYVDYGSVEESEIRKDLAKAQEVFKKLNVKNIRLIRAPTGNFDKKTLKVATQMGYNVVHWSIDSNDWKNPGTNEIIKKVEKAKKGDIVLLHASDSAKQTNDALPTIVENIRKKGLKFVTVSEMVANAEAKTEEIK